jgi:hypothetical protein
MPPKNIISKSSKNTTMHKSTRRVLKTVRAQQAQAELELEDEDPALAPVTAANNANSEDISVDDDEEAAFMRREEEEESDEDEDDEEKLSSNDDSDEPESVQVVPQKRKNGKDMKKPTSKPFCVIFKVF